jgi:hypothetical protein
MQDYDPRDEVAGGSFGWYVGAPVRFFSQFGILGIPFVFAYTALLIVVGTVVVAGGIWFSVNALFYLLFANF